MIDPGIATLASRGDHSSPATLRVDVIADLICPWCFLGKRRLDDALAAVHGPAVVSWFPFQLNPDMPATGMSFDDYLASRFGDADIVTPGLERLISEGEADGIRFRFDRISRIPNTLDAHRLIQLAEQGGKDSSRLAERLMSGFFEDGQDLSSHEWLVHLGEGSGLSAEEIHQTLSDEGARQVVLSQEAQLRKSGVRGVPDFLINKRLFVSGAQSADVLLGVFDRAMFGAESERPVSAVVH